MKRILFLGALLMLSFVGFAQNVENFEVGPYEVDYKGAGDYKFRFRKGVDLYEYFGLKRDTTIQTIEVPNSPVKGAFQLNVAMSMPRYHYYGWGINGAWKQQIGTQLYFNGGLSANLLTGSSDPIFEVGLPLSVELCNLDRNKASMYCGAGIVPTFYVGGKDEVNESKSGFFIAPRIDVGGYFPIAMKLIRLGAFLQYNINCTGGDHNIYKEQIGRFFIGANIGIVL